MAHEVTLDGSDSTTPVGTITDYFWEQLSGTPVTLSDETAVSPTFTAPAVATVGEVLRFQLTITDDRILTASDNVDIAVRWGFSDDFSTAPAIDNTEPANQYEYLVLPVGGATFTHLPGTEEVLVATGTDSLFFSRSSTRSMWEG